MLTVTAAPVRHFVPDAINLSDFLQIEPLYFTLLNRTLQSTGDLEKWLLDFSELTAAVDEYGARRYIDKSCHTDDAEIEQRFMQFIEDVEPKIKPQTFELQQKFLASPAVSLLDEKRYGILIKKWRAEVDLFRPENVPLETEITKLNNEYDKIFGAMTVQFDGKERTTEQMARYGEQTDRGLRQRAWEATSTRRLKERNAIDDIFDQQLELREKIAKNAGLDHYRSYAWKAHKRFDYTPDQCLQFADAIAKTCVPLVTKLMAERQEDMGLHSLRPWDLAVDPHNRMPLEPFSEDDIPQFVDKTKAVFERLSPNLAEDFESLRTHGNLDLQSRKGKQPGGYQSSLEESRQPFIFMNAAGLQRDVETLLHEGGHAFHCLAACDEPLVFLRSAPIEFCEVASMSMELLGSEHFDVFYTPVEATRARRSLLEGIIRVLPWIATIDSFQHWLYLHPGHSRQQRTAEWLRLADRFDPYTDWSGLESFRESSWQRQLHLFHVPFYYVEYGIAQLGALQLWLKAKEDPRRALANYQAALKLGGTKALPDLFAAAGVRFDFSERTLAPLIAALAEELASPLV